MVSKTGNAVGLTSILNRGQYFLVSFIAQLSHCYVEAGGMWILRTGICARIILQSTPRNDIRRPD